MSELKILSFKLIKKGEEGAEVELDEQDSACPGEGSKTCRNKIHPHLYEAMQALSPHLAVLCGYAHVKDLSKVDKEAFIVTAVHVSTQKTGDGIVITGQHKGDWGVTVLNTKFRLFHEKPETAYPAMADILEKWEGAPSKGKLGIRREIILYLTDGKKAEDPQQSMFDEDGFDGEEGGARVKNMADRAPGGTKKEMKTGG